MVENNLKKIRESKGFSQEYVAKALNISRQSISKWENNKACPDIENLKLLSQLYQISIDELINNSVSLPKSDINRPVMLEKDDLTMFGMLFIVFLTTAFISSIGLIVSGIILIKTIKKSYPKWFYILCILCVLFNIFNLGIFLNSMLFHQGIVTIQ